MVARAEREGEAKLKSAKEDFEKQAAKLRSLAAAAQHQRSNSPAATPGRADKRDPGSADLGSGGGGSGGGGGIWWGWRISERRGGYVAEARGADAIAADAGRGVR